MPACATEAAHMLLQACQHVRPHGEQFSDGDGLKRDRKRLELDLGDATVRAAVFKVGGFE